MEERRNRDFSKGPVWSPANNRWLVEIRYPDGSRVRKRLRREREALRLWASENAKIENGTWDKRAARNITVAAAMEQYREYSSMQHRAHQSMKMTMRYAHLSPAFLSAEVSLLDAPSASAPAAEGKKSHRARKGQSASNDAERRSEVPGFVREIGSPPWTIFAAHP